jgi:predicted dehydrogenase
MSDFNAPILIVGAGSIGERHIRNLWQLGYRNIVVFRQRNLPFRDLGTAQVRVVQSWDLVADLRPYAAIICSPTSFHLEQSLRLVALGTHVLVEKPLDAHTQHFPQLIEAVTTHNVWFQVGYMMRFHPLLQQIKTIIASRRYGNLLSIHSKWGEYLPDWHPWEDYRISYAAQKELGGGVALTLSHDLDVANWLADADVVSSYTQKNFASNLELNVEAGADVLIKYQNGTTANIHLNFYEKQKERFLKVVLDDASLHFDFFNASLLLKTAQGEEKIVLEAFDRNDLFLEQSKFFFQKINQFSLSESLKQIKDSETIINICNNGV